MKAAVFYKERGLVIETLPVPEISADQVLIEVSQTGFCGSDHSLIETEGTPDGTILGHEVSGKVLELGSAVSSVQVGDPVIIRPTFCGQCIGCLRGSPQLCSNHRRSIGIGDLPGGFAEYVVAFPQMLIPVPKGVDSENAALAELFAVALHGIHQAGDKKGSVLVIGSGAVGLALVKLLKLKGYGPVAVSEPNAEKRTLAAQFGADVTVDPLNENLQAVAFQKTTTAGFETVFECSGIPEGLATAMNTACQGGVVCQLSVLYKDIAINPAIMLFKEIFITGAYGNTHAENKQCLKWMAEKALDARALVSDRITLDQLPETYEHRIKKGKTVKALLMIGEAF